MLQTGEEGHAEQTLSMTVLRGATAGGVFMPANKTSTQDRGRPLTSKQACELFGIGYSTLKRAVAERRVPYTRLPGSNRLRFFENDLLAALEGGRIEAVL